MLPLSSPYSPFFASGLFADSIAPRPEAVPVAPDDSLFEASISLDDIEFVQGSSVTTIHRLSLSECLESSHLPSPSTSPDETTRHPPTTVQNRQRPPSNHHLAHDAQRSTSNVMTLRSSNTTHTSSPASLLSSASSLPIYPSSVGGSTFPEHSLRPDTIASSSLDPTPPSFDLFIPPEMDPVPPRPRRTESLITFASDFTVASSSTQDRSHNRSDALAALEGRGRRISEIPLHFRLGLLSHDIPVGSGEMSVGWTIDECTDDEGSSFYAGDESQADDADIEDEDDVSFQSSEHGGVSCEDRFSFTASDAFDLTLGDAFMYRPQGMQSKYGSGTWTSPEVYAYHSYSPDKDEESTCTPSSSQSYSSLPSSTAMTSSTSLLPISAPPIMFGAAFPSFIDPCTPCRGIKPFLFRRPRHFRSLSQKEVTLKSFMDLGSPPDKLQKRPPSDSPLRNPFPIEATKGDSSALTNLKDVWKSITGVATSAS